MSKFIMCMQVNDDPYASKATAQPAKVKSSFKIVIGFCQSTGTIVKANASLPVELTQTLKRLEALNLDLSIFPSWACLRQSTGFREHLLTFTLAPIFAFFVMAIPVLWARWRCSQEMARATLAQFIRSSCLLVVLVYPPVSSVVMSSYVPCA